MEKVYTASVTATGGRDGAVKSSDGLLDLTLRKPHELDGEGGASNPEQLFAAAWGACYLGALGSVAKMQKIEIEDPKVDVNVSFNKDGNGFTLSAQLMVHIPNLSIEDAQLLADLAHQVCPYSKATRDNIDVEVKAV